MDYIIGTPSQYSKTKMVSSNYPTSIPKGSYFILAKDGPEVAGSAIAERYGAGFTIRKVEVREDYRGMKVGTKLMTYLLDHLKPKELPIILYVKEDNAPAVALYKKLGFRFIKKGAFGDKYELPMN